MKIKSSIILLLLFASTSAWSQACKSCSIQSCSSVSVSVVYQGQTIYTNTTVPWIQNMNVTVALYNAQSVPNPSLTFQLTQYCPYGNFVTAINGRVQQSGSSYWALKVNGNYAQAGMDTQQINPNDKISFVYTSYKEMSMPAAKDSHQYKFFASIEEK